MSNPNWRKSPHVFIRALMIPIFSWQYMDMQVHVTEDTASVGMQGYGLKIYGRARVLD
jgi:hypothetical protein